MWEINKSLMALNYLQEKERKQKEEEAEKSHQLWVRQQQMKKNNRQNLEDMVKFYGKNYSDILTEAGLGEYCEAFEKNKLTDWETISSMTSDDLKDIGVESVGDRKKILSVFEIDSGRLESIIKEGLLSKQGYFYEKAQYLHENNISITEHYSQQAQEQAQKAIESNEEKKKEENSYTVIGVVLLVIFIVIAWSTYPL